MPTEAARAGLEISPLVAGAAFLAIGGWLNSERYLHESVYIERCMQHVRAKAWVRPVAIRNP